ncbi:energy transducer TonB [Aquincola sp. J276]|uniref:energy transducer TonB n=1 Tax=Aquincola sp. J276 TaxID=2898432 RepID=UPI0038572BA0
METAVRKAVGHVSGGPREVCSHAVRSNTARALLSMLNSVMSAELWTGQSHGQATGRSAVQPPQVRGNANGRWRQRNACRTRLTPSARPGRLQVPKAALAQWRARWQPVPMSTSTGELSMQRSSMLGLTRTARSSTCLALSMWGLLACTAPPSPRILVEAPSPAGPRQNARLCSAPRYPADALRADVEGTTRLLLDVSETGKVLKATVVRSAGPSDLHKTLDQAAIDSFTDCPFRPARDADGRPVGGPAMVEFLWKIQDAPPER